MPTVRYLSHDVDVSIQFYVTHLGFTLQQQMGSAFARVERDGLTLWLSGPLSSAARTLPDGRQPQPGGWNRLVLEVDDLPARVSTMQAAGVTFRSAIIQGPGGQQILVDDPSGNPVELFQSA